MSDKEYAYVETPCARSTGYTKVTIIKRTKKVITVQHSRPASSTSTVFTRRKGDEWLEKGRDKSKFQQRLRFDIEHVEQFLKEMEELRETNRRQSQLIADFQQKLRQVAGRRNFGADLEATLMRCLEEISLAGEES